MIEGVEVIDPEGGRRDKGGYAEGGKKTGGGLETLKEEINGRLLTGG